MITIKKTIGSEEKEVTLEDVYNKLSFLSRAVLEILSNQHSDPLLRSKEMCGLQLLQWEILDELELIMENGLTQQTSPLSSDNLKVKRLKKTA